ncbi:MAG TPA: hypothetical protein VFE29_04830 [Terriglobia bacterium]|nr:hypothetical protein [Terriglobia bacterium]
MIRASRVVAVSILALVAISPLVLAQWPDHPTEGVPLLPNGQPNLEAPTPRAADGKPDLSGIWSARGGGGGGRGQRGQRGAGGGAGAAAGTAPAAAAPAAPAGPPLATFFDIGAGIQGGPPFQQWAAELRKQRMADNMKDNPDAHCLPIGLTQMHLHPQPRKIIQTPKLIVMLYEAQAGVRQIFIDGRPLPNNDPQPWWYGYSIGRWEGDDLVVETTGFRDDVWLDVNGSPLTSTGKMTERMRRINYGNLQTDITIEDPKAYTKPFTVRVNHRIMLNTDLIEFICHENEKSSQYYDKTSK